MNPSADVILSDREIYSAALEFGDEQSRSAYVDSVCGSDVKRRQRIAQLLAAHVAQAANPLDMVVGQLKPAVTNGAETEGTSTSNSTHSNAIQPIPPVIDRYKIREQIGEGGMGVVYVAEQTAPVRRKVAIKVIKPGMNSAAVVARFEAERQALAMMDHPNIAKVLDGATLEDGRPYFVMELVSGVPITEFCDANQLTNRERLHLFIDVCSAVQHAHQKGIIHRDLKPSNVMVTMNDDEPMPKVIDFGIAKALGQQLTEHSIYTAFGQMIGTPLYMSPEQAQFSAVDVDTRSDVYSLGVMLYELLTGSTPFDQDTLQKSGIDEMRRLIREVDPPRPSQRVDTLKAESATTVSARRSVDQRTLSQSLSGELDWIVMKALEKRRDRRYESPKDFAVDIQRYLDDEQVHACPPSIAYRLRKYSKRHKGLLTTASLLMVIMLGATGVSIAYALQADQAKKEADQQKVDALTAKQLADKRLAQSRLDFNRAIKALDTVVEQLSSAEFAQIPAVAKTRSEMLERMITLYEEIAKEHDDDPYARQQQALAYGRIANILCMMDQMEEAETAVNQGVVMLEELLKATPNNREHKLSLAKLLFIRLHLSIRSQTERLADAEFALRLYQELVEPNRVELAGMLGLIHLKVAHMLPQDSPLIDQHISDSIRIPESHGLTPHWDSYITLARNSEKNRDWDAAEKSYRRGIELARLSLDSEDRIDRGLHSANLSRFATLLNSQGQSDEAKGLHLQAIDVARQLFLEYGKIPAYQSMLGARVQTYLEDATTKPQKQVALQLMENLVATLPDSVTAQEYTQRAALHQQLNQFPQAAADYDKAVKLEPNNHRRHYALATFLNHVLHPAFRDYDRALKHAERAVELKPDDVPSRILLASISHQRFHDTKQALIHLNNAIEFSPSNSGIFMERAKIHAGNRDFGRALEDANKAIQFNPNTWCYLERARIHTALKQVDFALADYSLANEADPENSYVYDERASIYVSQERYAEALVDLDKSLQIAPFKSWVYQGRSLVHFNLVQYDEALADIAKALELNPRDLSCLTWIDPELVANCPNKEFRTGMRALADHGVALNDRSAASLTTRAQILIAFGEWELAREDLELMVAAKDATYYHLFQASLLSVSSQDIPLYEQFCLKMLAAFADSDVPIETYFTAWTCALAPESIEDYTPAIKLARHSVEKEPDSQQDQTGLGAILMRSGQLDEGKLELGKALQLGSSSKTSMAYAQYFLALTEHQRGELELAKYHLASANQSAETELSKSSTWNRKLTLELLRKEAETLIGPVESPEFYYEAITSNDAAFLRQRGMWYQSRDEPLKAIADFTAIIEQNSDTTDVELWKARGNGYRQTNNPEKAIEDFTRAIAINPSDVKAFALRGQAYESIDQTDLAEADYESARKLSPDESSEMKK